MVVPNLRQSHRDMLRRDAATGSSFDDCVPAGNARLPV